MNNLGMKLPPHLNRPRRILIDASFTLGSGKSSGVERVVRSVWKHAAEVAASLQLPVPELVVSHGAEFYHADQAVQQRYESVAAMHREVYTCLPRSYRPIATQLCRTFPNQTLRKWLLPDPGHLGAFKLAHMARERFMRGQIARTATRITPGEDDLVLLPDAYWVNRLGQTIWPAAQAAREAGAKVVSFLYDLIPLSHPQFVGQERSRAFLDYMINLASNSDLVLAISKTVRDQAREFLTSLDAEMLGNVHTAADSPSEFCQDLRAFNLGCQINTEREGNVREEIRSIFADQSPYLMVSTFDPRKNHDFLIDAFDRLWDAGGNQRLVLIGRLGARCANTIERIRSHRMLGKQLFLLTDIGDGELQYAYENARAVVFPSHVEGYGLPIVESLSFGKRTLASDTPIHREVGRNDCVYFDLSNPGSLAAAVNDCDRATEAGEAIPVISRELTSWKTSTEDVFDKCLSLYKTTANSAAA
ncbi:MAG TPA: hypothetical protein DDW52_02355 [Planctomycetaceae bacterium]|nr:hypothetical protein [Planctomycetaceae bacterium]